MDKQLASELMAEVLKLTDQLNVVMDRIDEIEPDTERKAMRQHVGQVMAAHDEHLFRPILRQYPELEPHW